MNSKQALDLPGTMMLVDDLSDDDLFQTLAQISGELQARVRTRKLLGRIDPERLGLFPAGLVSLLIENGQVLTITQVKDKTGLTAQTIYDGVASTANPLQSLKIGKPGKGSGITLFLPAWVENWRKTVRPGKPSAQN